MTTMTMTMTSGSSSSSRAAAAAAAAAAVVLQSRWTRLPGILNTLVAVKSAEAFRHGRHRDHQELGRQ